MTSQESLSGESKDPQAQRSEGRMRPLPPHFSASPRWLRPRARPTRASEAVTYNPRTKGSDTLSYSVKEVLTNACRAERARMCHQLCARSVSNRKAWVLLGTALEGVKVGGHIVGEWGVGTCLRAPSWWVCTYMGGCTSPYGCVHRETGGLGVLPRPSISSP